MLVQSLGTRRLFGNIALRLAGIAGHNKVTTIRSSFLAIGRKHALKKDCSAVLLLDEGQMHNITKLRYKSRKKWGKNRKI